MLLVATWFAAFHVGVFRSADLTTFLGFVELHRHGVVQSLSDVFVWLCDPHRYVFWAPVVVVIALVRGRPRVALGVATLLLGANVTTETLKHVMPRAAGRRGARRVVAGADDGMAERALDGGDVGGPGPDARLAGPPAAVRRRTRCGVRRSRSGTRWWRPPTISRPTCSRDTWSRRLGRLWIVAALSAAERRWPSETTVDRISLRAALAPQAAVIVAAVALLGDHRADAVRTMPSPTRKATSSSWWSRPRSRRWASPYRPA